jgi:hypothetical protein
MARGRGGEMAAGADGDWHGQGEQREEKIEQIDDSWNRISLTTRWNGLFSKQF